MSPHQKEALYTLISSLFFSVILLLSPIIFKNNLAENVLLVFVLFIVSLWLIRERTGFNFKALNSEDKTIRFQAAMIGLHGFGATLGIYAIMLYLIHRSALKVPLHQVLLLATHSWLSLYCFWSAAILYLQKKGPLNI